jgi:O-antigen ligase
VKLATSVAFLLSVPLLVESEDDFTACAEALALGLIALNVRGFMGGVTAFVGYTPLHGISNKNGYSLYSLPALLLSMFALLNLRLTLRARSIHLSNVLTTAFLTFSTANRSGWLGFAVIVLMLAVQRRQWRSFLAILVLALASYGAWRVWGADEVFEYRLEQTQGGYASDTLRENLISEGMGIAAEHPLIGLGLRGLAEELAERTRADGDIVDPHNLIVYLCGGFGFPLFAMLLLIGRALWRRPPGLVSAGQRGASDLLRMNVILFLVRGFFSREIVFNSAVMIAIGCSLGWLLVENRHALVHRGKNQRAPASSS